MDDPAKKSPSLRQRLIRLALWPLLAAFLMIPTIRRWRRRPTWKWIRLSLALAGIVLLAVGWSVHGASAAGAVLLLLAAILGPLEDPERMQKLADELGARHVVNGGRLPAGDAALLFVTDAELLLAAAARPESVTSRIPLADIDAIEVDGAGFRPVYVTFAKAPPQRDDRPNRAQSCCLVLRYGPRTLELQYSGAFARHLADIAARTIHDCRNEARRRIVAPLPVIQ